MKKCQVIMPDDGSVWVKFDDESGMPELQLACTPSEFESHSILTYAGKGQKLETANSEFPTIRMYYYGIYLPTPYVLVINDNEFVITNYNIETD